MHHFVTEIYTHAHFLYKKVHCGIWDWCIMRLCNMSIEYQILWKLSLLQLNLVIIVTADAPAFHGARSSAGTVMTMFFSNYCRLTKILNIFWRSVDSYHYLIIWTHPGVVTRCKQLYKLNTALLALGLNTECLCAQREVAEEVVEYHRR